MADFNWTCPHCNRAQTVVGAKHHDEVRHLHVGEPQDNGHSVGVVATGCCNPDCLKITVRVVLFSDYLHYGDYLCRKPALRQRRIYPDSDAKPQPDFIPVGLREDYYEACLIRDESPKASATLSRRCLQGMIRNFCGITKGTLAKEIEALREAVTAGTAPAGVTIESVEAIDQVRSVGNIGAHMEKDIDLIVPVDPGEAQILIELTESLFEEWYVAAERRRLRFAGVAAVASEKQALLTKLKTQKALPSPETAEVEK